VVDVLKRLATGADVLVESFRPGVMDRLGVGWEALREVNPALVYCAITGYGQDGPYRLRAGHDINYIGYAGVLGIIGPRGGAPAVPGVQIGDIGGGGMAGAIGILAALLQARTTGVGRFVDTSMLDGVVSWLSIHGGDFLATGQLSKRGEMRLSGAFPCYRVYRAGDGKYLTVGALEPQFWRTLCEALGVPEMIEEQFSGDAAATRRWRACSRLGRATSGWRRWPISRRAPAPVVGAASRASHFTRAMTSVPAALVTVPTSPPFANNRSPTTTGASVRIARVTRLGWPPRLRIFAMASWPMKQPFVKSMNRS